MVHLDKVEGQRGSMVLHEDGSIISSTGSLASSEKTSSTFMSLLNNSLPMDFSSNSNRNSSKPQQNGHGGGDNSGGTAGGGAAAEASQPVFKWNRVTVDFGDHSYVACLSNKKIHIVDRESSPAEEKDITGSENNANE